MYDSEKQAQISETSVSSSAIVPPVTEPSVDGEMLPRHPATSVHQRRLAFGLLMLCIVCLGLGQTILFAILPPMARTMGLADMQVGIIFTISACMWVLMSPIWGRQSDVYGRKPIILLGVGLFAVSLAGLAVILQIGLSGALSVPIIFILLIALRSLHGIFASAGPAAAQAYIADRTAPEERTSSLAGLAAGFGLGASIGPGIGSATVQFGPVVPLFVVTGIAILTFFAILVYLPERTGPSARKARPKLKMTDSRLTRLLLYGVSGGILMVVPIQLVGFYLIDVLVLDELTASQFLGVALMISSMATLFSQLVLVQRFRFPNKVLLQVTPILLFFGHLIIALGNNFGTIVFGLMIAGLGTGMFMPAYNAAVSLNVTSDEQGAAAGLANSASAVGFIIAPLLAFSLYKISPQTPFYCTALFAFGLAFYAWKGLERGPQKTA